MHISKKIAAAGLAAGMFVTTLAAPANATVAIATSYDGGALTAQGTSSATNAAFNGSVGLFDLNLVTGIAALSPALLFTTANTQASALTGVHTLDIFVSRDGITGALPGTLTTGNLNGLTPGWTVELRTYVGSTLFSTTTLLSDQTLVTNLSEFSINGPGTGASPYSVTSRYTITATGAGQQNSTLNIAAVPEPTTWAMMLIGFGMIGFAARRRGRQTVRVAYA